MRIYSVQTNQSFNGKLYLTDKVGKITKAYKTTPIMDANLLDSFEKVHKPSKKLPRFSDLGVYLEKITEITNDKEFLVNFSEMVAVKSVTPDIWGKTSSYTTYKEGNNFTELETDGFKVTHDVRK